MNIGDGANVVEPTAMALPMPRVQPTMPPDADDNGSAATAAFAAAVAAYAVASSECAAADTAINDK